MSSHSLQVGLYFCVSKVSKFIPARLQKGMGRPFYYIPKKHSKVGASAKILEPLLPLPGQAETATYFFHYRESDAPKLFLIGLSKYIFHYRKGCCLSEYYTEISSFILRQGNKIIHGRRLMNVPFFPGLIALNLGLVVFEDVVP